MTLTSRIILPALPKICKSSKLSNPKEMKYGRIAKKSTKFIACRDKIFSAENWEIMMLERDLSPGFPENSGSLGIRIEVNRWIFQRRSTSDKCTFWMAKANWSKERNMWYFHNFTESHKKFGSDKKFKFSTLRFFAEFIARDICC